MVGVVSASRSDAVTEVVDHGAAVLEPYLHAEAAGAEHDDRAVVGLLAWCSWSRFHALISSSLLPLNVVSNQVFLWRIPNRRAGNHHLTSRPMRVVRHQQSASQPHTELRGLWMR